MPNLDPFTLSIVTGVNLILAGVALLFVAALRTGARGIKRCFLACALVGIAFALFPFRLAHPGPFGVLVTNIPLFASGMALLDGIIAFREQERPVWLYTALVLGYLPAFSWYTFVRDDFTARAAIHSIFMGGLMLLATWEMIRQVAPGDRSVYWATGASFAIFGFASLARGYEAAFVGPVSYILPVRPMDLLWLISLNLALLGCAFGLSMATSVKLQRRTEVLALYDPLTHLPNRRLFEERLEMAGRQSLETGQRLALIYCDLDDFKDINDTLGHDAGDEALRIVASRLKAMVSEDVCISRIGGDEFTLLIDNAPSREAVHAIVARLRNAIDGEADLAGRRARLQISCGAAIYPDDVSNLSDMLRLADAGMYMMKQHGRGSPVEAG